MPNFSEIWSELEEEAAADRSAPLARVYRALGDTAIGVRAAYALESGSRELLIEVPLDWSGMQQLPSWRGMQFEALSLSLSPRPDATQLRLCLLADEDEHIFLKFCADLVAALEGIENARERVVELEECIACWDSFFKGASPDGLSPIAQRGLYAELKWLERLLDGGLDPVRSVESWKGWSRNYHDFDLSGAVVEVKSTLSKEPRKVHISNERQLDDRGLVSLHLYVMTLHQTEGGGETLPDLVASLRERLHGAAAARFSRQLTGAGYLDEHVDQYGAHYLVREQELFAVEDGLPRIIDVPDGVGDLKYSVTPAACHSWQVDIDSYLEGLEGEAETA